MQFHNPNILYALFLLLIPIIIHLVRWKKFKTTLFTNVDFLQELEIKSRKSRKLKELIVLLLRLLAFAMLILAFARPFFPSKAGKTGLKEMKNIIYVDNSLSMSVLNGKTSLWQQHLQDLNNYLSPEKKYTLLTNDKIYRNINGKGLKKILYETSFSNRVSQHTKNLKKIALLSDNPQAENLHVLYLSDLQNVSGEKLTDTLFQKDFQYHFYAKQVKNLANISIDSIWETGNTSEYYELSLKLSANNPQLNTQVSIKSGEEILWNNHVAFKDSLEHIYKIQLPKRNIDGEVQISDKGFQFDNRLYFTLHQPEKIRVLVIGKNLPEYLKKIYTPDEFILEHKQANQLKYNNLDNYHLIVISDFSSDYKLSASALNQYLKDYGNLLIIPENSQEKALSEFMTSLQIPVQVTRDTAKVSLNKINFNHPVFEGIFVKKVKNFAYPFVREHYRFNRNGSWLYKLSDGTPFAQVYGKHANIFVLNAGLNPENTNFTSAPSLIVPLLYSLAFNNNKKEQLYYVLGQKNQINLSAQIDKDEIIKLKSSDAEYIPLQEIQGNKIKILIEAELPQKAGIYQAIYAKQNLQSIAFNYNRQENKLDFVQLPNLDNIEQIENLTQYSQAQENLFKEKQIWKWFLLLALLFLLTEMLVIKFWK